MAKLEGLEGLWLQVPFRFRHSLAGFFDDPRSYPFAPKRKQLHEGLDGAPVPIDAPGPLAVCAAYEGRVDFVTKTKGAYGIYMIASHVYEAPYGLQHFMTWYCHLETALAKPGQRVLPGDIIAHAGSTGNITGRHLHFNLCIKDRGGSNYVVSDVVDPLPYLVAG